MVGRLCRKCSLVVAGVVATLLFLMLGSAFTRAKALGRSASSVSLTSSPNPSYVGQTVTLTATVTVPAGDPAPTGNVNFMDGSDLLDTVALDGAGQAVHVDTAFISANHALRAEYLGDGVAAPSTSPVLSQLVYRNVPVVTGTTAPNPSHVGEPVTVTVTVAGGGGTPVPTGNVSFTVDGTPLGIVALDNAGQATVVTSALTAGLHTITVNYPGGIVFQSGMTNLPHTVDKNAPDVTLVSSNNPSLVGQPVTFTATVRGAATGAPPGTGNVVFKEGGSVLSAGALDANGQATLTTSSLAAGSHTITAEYDGDGYYLGGTSAPLDQMVNLVGASVALVSSDNPSSYGQSVTFTATATGSSGTPTGVMTFYDGTTALGAVNLGGAGMAELTTSALGTGSHAISAEYSGNGVYAPGATGTVTQIVDRAATATALAVSTGSTTTGTPITWTATVSSAASGTIGGTVTFNEGLTIIGTGTLGAGGVATTSAVLPAGTHEVTATFGGDSNYANSTSPAVTTVVTEIEAGIDAGADATNDASTHGDVAADRTGSPDADAAPPPLDGASIDAEAGSAADAPDAPREAGPREDARADNATRDSATPPGDVSRDGHVERPDVVADRTTPPGPDARADVAGGRNDAAVATDVRTDVSSADGGIAPPEDDRGCGCHLAKRRSARSTLALGAALLAVAFIRRRRKQKAVAP